MRLVVRPSRVLFFRRGDVRRRRRVHRAPPSPRGFGVTLARLLCCRFASGAVPFASSSLVVPFSRVSFTVLPVVGLSPSPRASAPSRSPAPASALAAAAAGRSLPRRKRPRGGRFRRRRRRDGLARALLGFCAVCGFGRGLGRREGQRGKDRASTAAADRRADGRKRRRERRREEDRGKTDCRRVAAGTHHALVVARLPIGIGHPCAHAGLVYVRKRLEAGQRPSSRLPRARTRPARRFPGGSAPEAGTRVRVGTRKTNAGDRRRRGRRARARGRGRACVSDRALLRRFGQNHHVRACRASCRRRPRGPGRRGTSIAAFCATGAFWSVSIRGAPRCVRVAEIVSANRRRIAARRERPHHSRPSAVEAAFRASRVKRVERVFFSRNRRLSPAPAPLPLVSVLDETAGVARSDPQSQFGDAGARCAGRCPKGGSSTRPGDGPTDARTPRRARLG